MRAKTRLLFILKYRETGYDCGTWNYGGYHQSSGLSNSAKLVFKMLQDNHREVKMVSVVDNNSIDREVDLYKPTHVIIEAFWVTPEKFDILKALHPSVTWIIRNHSKSEFLAQEGMAFGWMVNYLKRGVMIACNSPQSTMDMRKFATIFGLSPQLVLFLPNYYTLHETVKHHHPPHGTYRSNGEIDIGCFGAIRPFKNHISQAIAALEFVTDLDGILNFHINSTRLEGNGSPILSNLRNIFANLPQHHLVEHSWATHKHFKHLIHQMDFTTQVSFSETFNIVSADSVNMMVPVVGSKAIPWLPESMQADPSNIHDIKRKMRLLWLDLHSGFYLGEERKELAEYNHMSKQIWLDYFK